MTQLINPNRPEFIQDDFPYTLVLLDNMWYSKRTNRWKKVAKEAIWTRIVSIEKGAEVLREYIDRHSLCGSNFYGGNVYNQEGEYVGHYSYNGTFWDKESEYPNNILYL